jgi:F-type H+-transporting ATPase subunit epsilon
MLPEKIHLEIVTPERRVLEREVDEVVLPGADGSFGVRPGHAPLLAGLAPGVAICRAGGSEEVLALSTGYAEVTPARVTVMTETGERAADIDEERARKKVEDIESRLGGPQTPADADLMRLRLMKHLARLSARQQRR